MLAFCPLSVSGDRHLIQGLKGCNEGGLKNGFSKAWYLRLLIILWAVLNSSDCVTAAFDPVKAISFLGLLNLKMSPISLMIVVPVPLLILVMAVMGDSSFSMMPAISASVSFACFSIKKLAQSRL